MICATGSARGRSDLEPASDVLAHLLNFRKGRPLRIRTTVAGHNLPFSKRANLPLERLHYSVT
jgi:hypothetical protein